MISRRLRAAALVPALAVALAGGCRDPGEGPEEDEGPIRTVFLPTPRRPPTPAPTATRPKPVATPTPTPAAASPAATPTEAAAAPSPTSAPAIARKGVVERGTPLRSDPSGDARILGDFGGRTTVDVVKEESGYAFVRAPVIGGGTVEGWVPAGAVKDPAAAAPRATPRRAPKAAPAVSKPPAAMRASKGPDDILLVPIAGTAKKRPATPFTHKAHYDDYAIECLTCHHQVKALGNVDPPKMTCSDSGCHTANECNGQVVGRKNAACPNFEDAYHIQCIDCHKRDGGPTKCAECHTG